MRFCLLLSVILFAAQFAVGQNTDFIEIKVSKKEAVKDSLGNIGGRFDKSGRTVGDSLSSEAADSLRFNIATPNSLKPLKTGSGLHTDFATGLSKKAGLFGKPADKEDDKSPENDPEKTKKEPAPDDSAENENLNNSGSFRNAPKPSGTGPKLKGPENAGSYFSPDVSLTAPEFAEEDTMILARLFESFELPDSFSLDLGAEGNMLREDFFGDFELETDEIVTISEELAIDCVWITLRKYYAVWDSERINPYDFDTGSWNDSTELALYDSSRNLYNSMPLDAVRQTSSFGFRRRRWHHGVDLDLTTGDPVRSAFDGIVRINRYNGRGYGNFAVIRHYNGLETLYGHMSKSMVEVGDVVKAGQQIGKGGSTGRSSGPHLHFEVRFRGFALDPALIYDFDTGRLHGSRFTVKPEHFSHLGKTRTSAYHTIKKGDSLSKIAGIYGTSVSRLCKMNGISSRTSLRPGRKLRVR